MILLLLAQAMVQMPAAGIPNAVPPTGFSCNLMAGDGTHFTVAGTTPEFPAGWDPNSAKYVDLRSSHAEAFRRTVGIDPGDAGEWFREFQVTATAPGDVRYTMTLLLRRAGTSVAYVSRYQSTGKQIPYDYHSAGVCTADFAPAAGGEERGR
jgi:hypothetical protein